MNNFINKEELENIRQVNPFVFLCYYENFHVKKDKNERSKGNKSWENSNQIERGIAVITNEDETLLIKKNPLNTNHYQIFSTQNNLPKDLISYLQEKKRFNFLESINYINEKVKEKKMFFQNKNTEKKTKEMIIKTILEEPVFNYFLPLSNNTYLKKRHLDIDFLKEKNLIQQSVKNAYNKEKKTYDSISFILYNKTREKQTAIIKNENMQQFLSNITTNGALFLSNPNNDKKYDTILFSETPIDGFSFVELNKEKYKNKEILVVSSCGNINEEQLVFFKKIIEEQSKNFEIELANDNDIAGKMFSEKIKTFLSSNTNIKVVENIPIEKDFNEDLQNKKISNENLIKKNKKKHTYSL